MTTLFTSEMRLDIALRLDIHIPTYTYTYIQIYVCIYVYAETKRDTEPSNRGESRCSIELYKSIFCWYTISAMPNLVSVRQDVRDEDLGMAPIAHSKV